MRGPAAADETGTTGAVRVVLGLVALLAGCAEHPVGRGPVWLAERGKVYCYRTLAQPDCHARAVSGAEGRLIGVGPEVYFRPL